ncbi:cell division protein FtsA [Sphingobium sp. B2D3A]|uniref:cell division protein FtsA n=1 Tax=unclassified Sphingobium TaxID=2611147 RepID=UPI0022248C9A|nr:MULTISPECIES: cell division protein FtsA [unclassified Sphingobium]MCW2337117.1 cell division protein FtsA [Sphingobium sp. B2D3A]MCW2365476.1 cell division protein FtsA [Sphingobium sp. B7D2B]MCW2383575.1 cell division protein FtsA [Sphingobium sp. B2D3D]MCW2393144.1 cell division protein FtsA [Sphingobium sp. B11D3A]MCW2404949.1 cell division protein FtsA [Sphingobium sp. B1D7B]
MAARNDGLITAIDIGTWKVSALIARKQEDGTLAVLGTGQRESRGVRRGFVVDMERTELAVRETVEQAEKVAGTNIEKVILSFSGGSIESKVEPVEINVGGRRIEQADIESLYDQARERIDPGGRVILQAQPTLYTIDGMRGVARPMGLHADQLGVDIHVVLADSAPLRNLETSVRGAYLDVQSIIAAPVATAAACLSDEERDLGVALVELGAGVTNVSLHIGGMLVGFKSIPIGAADVTDDIASAFGIRRSQAERMKCFYGSAMQSRRDFREIIEIAPAASSAEQTEARRVTRAELVGVICERLNRLMAEVNKALGEMGFHSPVGRQVVLTGGGAELKGMADYAQTALGRAVRIGRPKLLDAMPEAHRGPAFATLAGLALYASKERQDLLQRPLREQRVHTTRGGAVVQRLIAALRAGY